MEIQFDDPATIVDYLIQHKTAHLSQSQENLCTIKHLSSLLQDNIFTKFCDENLKNQTNLSDKSLNPLQIMFFKKLKE